MESKASCWLRKLCPEPGSVIVRLDRGPFESFFAWRLTEKLAPAGIVAGVIVFPAVTTTVRPPTVKVSDAVFVTGVWPGTVTVAPTVFSTVVPSTRESPVARSVSRCETLTHCAEAVPDSVIAVPA